MKVKGRQSTNIEDRRKQSMPIGPQQKARLLSKEPLSEYKKTPEDNLTIANPGTNVLNHSLPTILQGKPMTDGDTSGMGGMANAGASRKPDSDRKYD